MLRQCYNGVQQCGPCLTVSASKTRSVIQRQRSCADLYPASTSSLQMKSISASNLEVDKSN